ncbi:hypothetical protein [Winogradskyella sp. SYSU M77433]|uniref:hypothetical protein n=1 Tax=Winogradskyella sp. SYSU M77433 TaxID=3042722 RepID=UPI00247FF269|nr:hypothetical protein [Winogradskyella sp. SYSU M77433]MDH7912132.1 hypothetical protein [Winogradskyella sp. SYSU M77433]
MVFRSPEFIINGIKVPEFQLEKGSLIRIYVPNFDYLGKPLDFDLTLYLIERFQKQIKDLTWAKNYHPNEIIEFLSPLSVKGYLVGKKKIKLKVARRIAEELMINLTDKYNQLDFEKRKALIIKAAFENSDFILLDYYACSALAIDYLEGVVNSEIEKNKSAIAFDVLQYAHEKEPFRNIKPIKLVFD